jgi:hypothetical protein
LLVFVDEAAEDGPALDPFMGAVNARESAKAQAAEVSAEFEGLEDVAPDSGGALRALVLAADGDDPGAVTALAGALMLACPQGHVRVFADEGPSIAALLDGSSRPSAPGQGSRPPPASGSATWPGCSAPSAPRIPRRNRAGAPYRRPASSTR